MAGAAAGFVATGAFAFIAAGAADVLAATGVLADTGALAFIAAGGTCAVPLLEAFVPATGTLVPLAFAGVGAGAVAAFCVPVFFFSGTTPVCTTGFFAVVALLAAGCGVFDGAFAFFAVAGLAALLAAGCEALGVLAVFDDAFAVPDLAALGLAWAGAGFGPAVCFPLGVGEGFAGTPGLFAAFCAAAAVAMTVASARI